MCYLSCYYSEIPERSDLRVERFILTHTFRGYSPSWQGMYEGRVREICNCGIRTLKHGFLHQTEEERFYYALGDWSRDQEKTGQKFKAAT